MTAARTSRLSVVALVALVVAALGFAPAAGATTTSALPPG